MPGIAREHFFQLKKIWFKKKFRFLNKNVEFFLVYVTPRASMGYLKNVGTFSWIRKIWLSGSGSGSSKICGSKDKISTKNYKKNFFTLKTLIWTIEKREIKKISRVLNGESSFSIIIISENSSVLKKSVNLKEMSWIRIRIHIKIKCMLRTAYKYKNIYIWEKRIIV